MRLKKKSKIRKLFIRICRNKKFEFCHVDKKRKKVFFVVAFWWRKAKKRYNLLDDVYDFFFLMVLVNSYASLMESDERLRYLLLFLSLSFWIKLRFQDFVSRLDKTILFRRGEIQLEDAKYICLICELKLFLIMIFLVTYCKKKEKKRNTRSSL